MGRLRIESHLTARIPRAAGQEAETREIKYTVWNEVLMRKEIKEVSKKGSYNDQPEGWINSFFQC